MDISANDHPIHAIAEPLQLVMFHQSAMELARNSGNIANVQAIQQSGKFMQAIDQPTGLVLDGPSGRRKH